LIQEVKLDTMQKNYRIKNISFLQFIFLIED